MNFCLDDAALPPYSLRFVAEPADCFVTVRDPARRPAFSGRFRCFEIVMLDGVALRYRVRLEGGVSAEVPAAWVRPEAADNVVPFPQPAAQPAAQRARLRHILAGILLLCLTWSLLGCGA